MKSPLEFYEKAITDLRTIQAEIKTEWESFKTNVQESYIHEIQILREQLRQTKEELAEQIKQSSYSPAQDELSQVKKAMMEFETNHNQILDSLSAIQVELSEIKSRLNPNYYSEKSENFDTKIEQIDSKISHLTDELTLVSSATGIDYRNLNDVLIARQWKQANDMTHQIMCKISNRELADWLDRGEIERLPWQDLRIINHLWVKHSQGQFGFSVQKEIWQNIKVEKNDNFQVEKTLGDLVGWRLNNNWIRYEDLQFDVNLPKGCLPLIAHLFKITHGQVADRISFFFSYHHLKF